MAKIPNTRAGTTIFVIKRPTSSGTGNAYWKNDGSWTHDHGTCFKGRNRAEAEREVRQIPDSNRGWAIEEVDENTFNAVSSD